MPADLDPYLTLALRLSGAGQLALAAGSLAIPRVLGWREALAPAGHLVRQVFWVYAGYILMTNVALGLVSLLLADALVEGTPLALAVSGYALLYWGARAALQFWVLDLSEVPRRTWTRLAERALDALFVVLTAVYAAVVARGVGVL